MMLTTYVNLLFERLLHGQPLRMCLTPLPAHEQLAVLMLVPRLRRWQVTTEWN
ncbi:MAG: hypothetical protein ACYC6C_13970 [Coriobacteriia bacterium]